MLLVLMKVTLTFPPKDQTLLLTSHPFPEEESRREVNKQTEMRWLLSADGGVSAPVGASGHLKRRLLI